MPPAEVVDEVPIDDVDVRATPSRAARDPGPLSVCLACGESPFKLGECPHDEVVHLRSASDAVRAAVAALVHTTQEQRAQSRQLRRLAHAAVSDGDGDLVVREPPQPPPPPPPLQPGDRCPRCGQMHPESDPALLAPRPRRKGRPEGQGLFAFAVEPEPPPVEVVAPEPARPEVTEASPPKRGRKRKSVAVEEDLATTDLAVAMTG